MHCKEGESKKLAQANFREDFGKRPRMRDKNKPTADELGKVYHRAVV